MELPDVYMFFSTRERSVIRVIVENRPKWISMLLYLRKNGVMTMRDLRSAVRMSYASLKRALYYLGGIEVGKERGFAYQPPLTPLGIEPLVTLISLSPRKKYIALTEHGEEFTNNLVRYLKTLVRKYGSVDIESKYGIPRVYVVNELSKKVKSASERDVENIVSLDELYLNITRENPRLLQLLRPDILRPELLDMVPLELTVVTGKGIKKLLLYLVQD